MTRDDILKLACEAGFPFNKYGLLTADDEGEINADAMLERFAALVAAAERAACADICDQHASIEGIAQRCAAEIRARGNT